MKLVTRDTYKDGIFLPLIFCLKLSEMHSKGSEKTYPRPPSGINLVPVHVFSIFERRSVAGVSNVNQSIIERSTNNMHITIDVFPRIRRMNRTRLSRNCFWLPTLKLDSKCLMFSLVLKVFLS